MNIAAACALTVAVETPVMAVCGPRDRGALAIVALANVATNLLLNLTLLLAPGGGAMLLAALEAAATAAEALVFAAAFGRTRRRILFTVAANALSLGLGLLLRP